MPPILIDFGTHDLPVLGPTHLALPTYGFLFALAALVSWGWFLRRARTIGISDDHAFNLGFYTLLAGILGAKLALIALEWRFYLDHPAELLSSFRSAGVLMGGIVVGALAFIWYAKRNDLPYRRLGDAIAAPLAFAQSVGRLGCFSAGCCYGVPVDSSRWYAVVFHNPIANEQTGVPLEIPLFPAQLVQMINDLLLAVLLTWMWRRRPEPPGTVFWWYVLLYSLTRGTIEFWRGDSVRGLWFGGLLSTSQILAIIGIAVASVMLVLGVMHRREPRTA